MKAILHEKYGGPGVLQIAEIEKPSPNPVQVLVKVHASTVNRTDCAILRGKPLIMRLFHGFKSPKINLPGTDFAGEVEAIGAEVTNYKVGDKVFGFNDSGMASKAEYLVIEEDGLFSTMPEVGSYVEAAASLEGVHYAYNFINKIELKKGDEVLVNGATGAIGSAMVQLLKYFGSTVTAVGNTKNLNLMRSIGADEVIDFTKEDFTRLQGQFDYVFDAVGKSTFAKCRPILKDHGVYISSELGPYIQNPLLALISPLMKGRKVKFPFPTDVKTTIRFIKKRIEEGNYKAVIDRTYQLEEIEDAYRYVETGEKTGNVVVKIT